jgi:endonuclease/exonuclease/phosphatase (EEP) superfamily protein YafD
MNVTTNVVRFASLVLAAVIVMGSSFTDDFGPLSEVAANLCSLPYIACALLYQEGIVALFLLGMALWYRAWAVALMLVLACAIAILPEHRPRERVVPEKGLTIFSANLWVRNSKVAPILDQIRATSPDIVLLQEYTPAWEPPLARALSSYHFAGVARTDPFGLALFSRYPIRSVRHDLALGSWQLPQTRAVIDVLGRAIAVYNLHLATHNMGAIGEHRRQFRDLLALLERETQPAIVAGDFNFTARMPEARALFDRGFIDAHLVAYPGRATTWPAIGLGQYFPGIAIDHVFVKNPLQVVGAGIGKADGSDHHPITAIVK